MLLDILYAVIKSVIAFVILMIVLRRMGRKSIAEMTYFDFGVAMVIGTVTASVAMGNEMSFHATVTVLLTFGILDILSGIIHIHSLSFNKLINSEPLVVIENGMIVQPNLRKARLAITELTALLREKDIFNIADVQFAILERNGKLSVLPKADRMPLTPDDMQMHPADKGLTKDIIIDGKIMSENLNTTNLTDQWLLNEIQSKGVQNIKEVFFAALDSSGELYVSKRTIGNETPGKHGIE